MPGIDIGIGVGIGSGRARRATAILNGPDIYPSDNIAITFSEVIDPTTVSNNGDGTGSFEVKNETAGTWVAGVLSSADNIVWVFNPTADLTVGNDYRVYLTTVIRGVTTGRQYSGTDFLFSVIADPILFRDQFNDAAINTTKWGVWTSGGGVVSETTSLAVSTTAANGAYAYSKDFDKSNARSYIVEFSLDNLTSIAQMFGVYEYLSLLNSVVTSGSDPTQRLYLAAVNSQLRVRALDQAGTDNILATHTLVANTHYRAKLTVGSTWRLQLLDTEDVVLADSGALTLGTDIKNGGNTHRLMLFNEPYSDHLLAAKYYDYQEQ